MSSISNSNWRVPLLSKSNNKLVVIEFVSPTTPPLYIDEKKPKYKTKKVDEYSILILSIDDVQASENENALLAIVRTEQLEYGGTVLIAIEYEGESYFPEDGIYYWFPPLSFSSKEKTRPKKLTDGSIRIQLQNTTEIDSIYASPLYSIPFMDLTGAFRYEYIAVAYTKKTTGECQSFRMPITMVETNDKFTTMIDNASRIAYSIERTNTFREIIAQKK